MDTPLTLPPIPLDAHKYSRGSLLVLAGSRRYYGAGVLATLAAEKTGAGYVSLATPTSALLSARQHLLCSPVIEGNEVEELGSFCDTALSDIVAELHHIDAICCGPGLTVTEGTTAFVGEVLRYAAAHATPLLLDADALNVIATRPNLVREAYGRAGKIHSVESTTVGNNPLILTPHVGELTRLHASEEKLTSKEAVFAAAHELAKTLGSIVVAKGPTTLITDGRLAYESNEATPALAKAGTGDVLAGIISSLLAQGVHSMDAAVLGVKIHSKAAVFAQHKSGCRSVTAVDVIEALPQAIIDYEEK